MFKLITLQGVSDSIVYRYRGISVNDIKPISVMGVFAVDVL